jgi:hypothetical protein
MVAVAWELNIPTAVRSSGGSFKGFCQRALIRTGLLFDNFVVRSILIFCVVLLLTAVALSQPGVRKSAFVDVSNQNGDPGRLLRVVLGLAAI